MRRLRWLTVFAWTSIGFGVAGEASPPQPASRPNIILLLLDDQDAFTPMWDAMPRTNGLVRQAGVSFPFAFSPTPICSPGRVSLISGRLAHNTGVYTLVGPTGGWRFESQERTSFAVVLDKLGYKNALFGKSWGRTAIAPGWDTWCALGGDKLYEGYGYEVTEQRRSGGGSTYTSGQYSTDFLADKVVNFVRANAGRPSPFFVWLAPTAPHLPLPPASRHAGYANRRWKGRMPTHRNFNERNVADKSNWLRSSASVRSAAVPYAPGEYPKRMGSLLAVDEMMGRIHDALADVGEWENTVVIVTSDNGYNLGAHRLIHKMAPYEESIRIPLVMSGPGIPHGEMDGIVGLHDLGPTIIDIAGGVPPGFMDGKSLLSLISGGTAAWRSSLVTEYNTGGVTPGYNPGGSMKAGYALDIPTYRSVRTNTHKYIVWLATGEEEIYDLVHDPFELNNLVRVNRAAARRVRPFLRIELAAGLRCSGGNCP